MEKCSFSELPKPKVLPDFVYSLHSLCSCMDSDSESFFVDDEGSIIPETRSKRGVRFGSDSVKTFSKTDPPVSVTKTPSVYDVTTPTVPLPQTLPPPPRILNPNPTPSMREVISKIKTVTYGVLTEGEIVAMASCEVFAPSNKGSASLENTPYDPRLGALDNADVCQYCDNKNKQCPGHFGYMRLAYPVYNPRHIDTVLSILKCICVECAEPRISKDVAGPMLSLKGLARQKVYKKQAAALKNCSMCQAALYSFFRDKSTIRMFQNDKKSSMVLSAADARSVLLKISDETMVLLGFNGELSQNPIYLDDRIELRDGKTHPHQLKAHALIYTVLIIPPTCMRPWVVRNGTRLDDDLTDALNTIIKTNVKLLADINAPAGATSGPTVGGKKKAGGSGRLTENERAKMIEDFGNRIWAISDTPVEKSNKNNSRKQKGLVDRISKGKKSHLEDYVRGKRSDHTARDVIVGASSETPADSMGIDEETARILTKPEVVLSFNYDYLTKLLEEGKITTVDRGGHTIFVSEVTKKGTVPFAWGGKTGLQPYDTVHRQLRDGDWVILNRQPSLRIESMQAVKVKIVKFPAAAPLTAKLNPDGSLTPMLMSRTNMEEHPFRIQLFQTGAYNADFDGDEMNIHVPQSISATSEIATISRTACHIISAQNSAPIIGPVQNTLLYSYLLTETFTTPEEFGPSDEPNFTLKTTDADGTTVETPGFQTLVSREDFMDAVVTAEISQERYVDFLSRAREVYPEYFEKSKGAGQKFENSKGAAAKSKEKKGKSRKEKSAPTDAPLAGCSLRLKPYIPGKMALSIIFPKTFSWKRRTNNNEYLPLVRIEKGIIAADSGPLCKKCVGATAGSTLHPLWKMSPDLSLRVMWELQAMISIFIVRMGFSMGISDCLTTPEGEDLKKRTVAEVFIKCEMINDDPDRTAEDKERDTNSALNQSMNISAVLAKKHMLKGRRNALNVMANAGAKGSTTNSSMVTAFVGQQNIEGKRPKRAISQGQRSSTHFAIGDNTPAARGFISHSYMDGLTPSENWSHAASGRRGVVDTAMKTSESGYVQKQLGVTIGDVSIHHDGTARDANMAIVQFCYGADGFSAKELIRTENLPDQLFYTDPFFVANVLNLECEYRSSSGAPEGGYACKASRRGAPEEGYVCKAEGEKRPLTSDEISDLLASLEAGAPGFQTDVTERVSYNIRALTRVAINGVEVYESVVPEFCAKIRDDFEEAKAKRGYMAGLVASSGIGEPTTQMTLNTFHHAGQSSKDVTLGVPRLKELLRATHSPSKPACTIYEDPLFECLTGNFSTGAERQAQRETIEKLIAAEKRNLEAKKKLLAKEAKSAKADAKGKKTKTSSGAAAASDVEKSEAKIPDLEAELKVLEKEALLESTLFSKPFASLTVANFLRSVDLRYLPIVGEDGKVRNPSSSPIGLLTYEEYEKRWWVTLREDFGDEPEIQPAAWVIILKLDTQKLYEFKLSPEDIAEKIQDESSGTKGTTMCCVASPDIFGEIEVYVNFADITTYILTKVDLPERSEDFSVSEKKGKKSSSEPRPVVARSLLSAENIDYFTAREVALNIIEKTPLQGIAGISKTFVRHDEVEKEWVIDSQGTNLSVILATPGVDGKRTISDDMWEILKIFGIEAARTFLIKEITGILSFDGTFVNRRHVQLLVDVMTRTGTITSVTRDGISRDVGPIAKGMFEKAVENFTEAAVFGEHDKMKSVASSIMFGTTVLAGTGTVEIKDLVAKRLFEGGSEESSDRAEDRKFSRPDPPRAKKGRAPIPIPIGRGKK